MRGGELEDLAEVEEPAMWQLEDVPPAVMSNTMMSPADLMPHEHMDHPGDDFITFHRYNSDDIIYEVPR